MSQVRDIVITTNGYLIAVGYGINGNDPRIKQWTYPDGEVTNDISLPTSIVPSGIFTKNGNIYITQFNGPNIYQISLTSPFEVTLATQFLQNIADLMFFYYSRL
jgi:hypothetical protein